ncbi:MAG TPA: glycosyltransferase [Longimicrobium sp.]|nr:glycosyltransferase [Longimicrobium sp.]
MRLTVMTVAFPFAPVSGDACGGAEQVAWAMDAALVRAGHRSIVVAHQDSRVAGTLVPVPAAKGEVTDDTWPRVHATVRTAMARALARWPVDVVHMHGVDFHAYLPAAGVPVLATLHLPPAWYPAAELTPRRPDTWLNPVSAAQARDCPRFAALLDPVPNGIDLARLECRARKRGWAMAMGRICPEKGFHHALDAARMADVPLLLAGEVHAFPRHHRYHAEQIVPRLNAGRRHVGPVGIRRKRRLLAAARCLLVPSVAPETSSLVAMEAIACGTPVVAFDVGALPEVVEHGRTGFIVRNVREMADAVARVGELHPEECRAAARERFSGDRMAARYMDLYHRLASRRAGAAA